MQHETPSQEIFDEMKKIAIEIWNTYDDTHGYATDKIARVNDIENYADNIMIAFRMFDNPNQTTFISKVNNKKVLLYIFNNQ